MHPEVHHGVLGVQRPGLGGPELQGPTPGHQLGRDPLDVRRRNLITDVPYTWINSITYDPGSTDFWNGYGAVQSADALLERYEDLVSALLDSPVVAGFCYTQLTDTAQERNGLLDEDRVPKVDPAAVAAINRRASASVPADAIAEIQIVHAARAPVVGEPAGDD